MAALPPMPNARTITAVAANAGFLRAVRRAPRTMLDSVAVSRWKRISRARSASRSCPAAGQHVSLEFSVRQHGFPDSLLLFDQQDWHGRSVGRPFDRLKPG